jgi:hypothetical protein
MKGQGGGPFRVFGSDELEPRWRAPKVRDDEPVRFGSKRGGYVRAPGSTAQFAVTTATRVERDRRIGSGAATFAQSSRAHAAYLERGLAAGDKAFDRDGPVDDARGRTEGWRDDQRF